MEKIQPKIGKDENGKEVYMIPPEQFNEIIQRAMMAGATGAQSQQEAPPQQEANPLDEMAAMGGM